ncbi:NUDIX hydrolase [Pseudodesulfovibrio sediminis]|uniref:Nudix hydrolase domain-containing protein n=1 Tax=Pseudodesulfovibrio sediminis TaxID=2810563 RepID=A0ABN6EMA2_9BACT|nr:NUDIX domain-containing protein [Pseudodesulfovibrio sediminis]BCS87152.1 hypothetical protein PSDVSF_03940 [Pseudodesulfovibrio sediminis]
MIFNKKAIEDTDDGHNVEVIDQQNRPLAVLPKRVVHRQLLMHRSVQVIVTSPDKKIYLQKRNSNKQFFPGRWDISARTHPIAGEATFDAAIRALKNELDITVEHPLLIKEFPPSPETGFEHVSIYAVHKNTQPIIPNKDTVAEGYYYSQEELTCLIKEFKELLTPNLVILWESGLLSEI